MKEKLTASATEENSTDDDQGLSSDSDQNSSPDEELPQHSTEPPLKAQPNGQEMTIDNIDYRQEVHHMTEDNQTIDRHYLTVCATENRISGNHLSTKQPDYSNLKSLENGKCIPSSKEQLLQRENYIQLTQRALVKIFHV